MSRASLFLGILFLAACSDSDLNLPPSVFADCKVKVGSDPDLAETLLIGDWYQDAFLCPGSDVPVQTEQSFMIRFNPDHTLEVWIESSIVSNHTWHLVTDDKNNIVEIRIEPPATRTSPILELCLLPRQQLRFLNDARGCDQFYIPE